MTVGKTCLPLTSTDSLPHSYRRSKLSLADSLVAMATMSVSWQEPYQRKSILHPLRYNGYTLIKPYSIYLPKGLLKVTLKKDCTLSSSGYKSFCKIIDGFHGIFYWEAGGHYITMLPADWLISTSHDLLIG